MKGHEQYEDYRRRMQRIADIRNASALLQWDQETYLPPKAAALRGQQISTLSELSHQLFTAEDLGVLLQTLADDATLDEAAARNVERTLEDYRKNKKYSSAFVRLLSEQTNKAFHAWIDARSKNDFRVYEKALDTLVELKRQEADLLGYEGHRYNALLDEFEKGCTVDLVDRTFEGLLPTLRELLQRIMDKPPVDESFLHRHYPRQKQWDWGLHLLRHLHFNFGCGRQDISEHPFSISFGASDVRVTTRIDEQDFANMTWSTIHEAGHALYEQGLPPEQYGLPLGEACSYSIHESQSRLWENNVGRSRGFWQHYLPQLQDRFPEALSDVDLDRFYRGINSVKPSLIRTEADEITYHFHVYIRYELEKRLIGGELKTADIPAYWNEQYRQLLGVTVPDDRSGCLQDVHWSHGSFGYFPTYSLGSFYAAQFFSAAQQAIPGLEAGIAEGQTASLLNWLRAQIHAKGRFHTSEELCKDVTGKTLDVGYFVDYLLQKYTAIYTL
jgi:carboxypeptidase Taq